MEHFVSIITKNKSLEESLVESVLNSANVALLENETNYEMFETVSNEQVLRVELHRELTEQEADDFAETLADKLFEMGFEDFELEVSATESEDLPFDIVEDLHVFMKNDPTFYRKDYFPTMVAISDQARKTKKVDFNSKIKPMIGKAVDLYCEKFGLPKSTKELFNDEKESGLIQRIREEEIPRIQQGEY
jgi:hypothetical protein